MTIKVGGMMCNGCAKRVTNCLTELGLTNIKVNLDTKEVSFEGTADKKEIENAILDLGFEIL